MSALIRLEGASVRVKSATLIEDVSFEVAPQETLALIGRSGSGKTTALRLINRLYDPVEGRVLVEDRSTLDWDPIQLRRRIGYVIQEVGLFPHMTIAQNVALPSKLQLKPPAENRERAEELLGLVGLDPAEVAQRYPRQLSGGQRQRVGVARALAVDPPILLMDEPFGAVDPITRAELQQELLRIQQELHKAIVFVTHDLREALLIGARIGVMEAGRLVWLGSPDEFQQTSAPAVHALRETVA